jgi:cation efflux family protein
VRDVGDGHAIDDHASQDLCVLRLELIGLNQHAPAVEVALVDGGRLELVDWEQRFSPPAQLVEQYVAYDAAEPRLGALRIAHLIGSFERPLEGALQHLLRVDAGAAMTTHHGQKLFALCPEGTADRVPGRAEIAGGLLHELAQSCSRTGSVSTLSKGYDARWQGRVQRTRSAVVGTDSAPRTLQTIRRVRSRASSRQNIMTMTTSSLAATCGCATPCAEGISSQRSGSLRSALQLEYLTVGWNVVEGSLAVTAAVIAGSVAVLGFGIDSFVECASALVLIWRLRAERDQRMSAERLEHVEQRARRLVAGSLFLLAGYVGLDAIETLWSGDRPRFSAVGGALLMLSIGVMLWLARAKRRLARELGSEALEADAFQTTACWWLSVAALTGVGLNGLLGWWWADPIAAVIIALLIAREGREAWQGRACC